MKESMKDSGEPNLNIKYEQTNSKKLPVPPLKTFNGIDPQIRREYREIKKTEQQRKELARQKEVTEIIEGVKKVIGKLDSAAIKAEKKELAFTNEARNIIIQNGIDRIVIHGKPITDQRKELWENSTESNKETIIRDQFKIKNAPPVEIKPDLSARGALYILDEIQKVHPEIYNEGIFLESTPKGNSQIYEPRTNKKEVILFLGAGNTYPHIEEDKFSIKIFADRNEDDNENSTSTAKTVHDMFLPTITDDNSLLEKNKTFENLVSFINKFDNLEFLKELNTKNEKKFNKNYFVNKFPYSLYSLAKILPFEILLEIIKDPRKFKEVGQSNDWMESFSRNEVENGELGNIKIKIQNPKNRLETQEKLLKDLVKQNFFDNRTAISGIENAIKFMETNNINTESPILGKTVFHNFAEIEIVEANGKKKKARNTIPQNVGYIATKAMGFDTLVFYNPREGTIFINSDGNKDLTKIWERIEKHIPGYPKPVNNQYLFPPKDPEILQKSKEITEQEWLEILELK